MYENLANYYDVLGWADYSDDMLDSINYILAHNNIVPKNICDLGCGTGELIMKLHKFYEDIEIIGIDISEEMIKVAKKKCKDIEGIRIQTGDMRKFELAKKADLITCMFDSINHLLKFEDWKNTLKSIYNNLMYGGIAIIDIVPIGGLKSYVGQHVTEKEDGTMIRTVRYDEESKCLTTVVNAFVRTGLLGTYKNVKESEVETSFRIKLIKKIAHEAGFKKCFIYDSKLKKHAMNLKRFDSKDRMYLVLIK